ncbi:MAG: SEL1-like repeat protein [Terriglobia bacterium]
MGTYYLASVYETGLGRTKNINEAVRLYRKPQTPASPTRMRSSDGCTNSALCAERSGGRCAFLQRSGQRSRSTRDVQARSDVSRRHGRGATELETACQFFLQAAKDGNSYAQGEIGICYYMGQGMPRDAETAFAWFLHAAEASVTRAQEFVGEMYERGEGVAQSDAKAVEWYRTAAMQGDPYGMFRLGAHLREGGRGMERGRGDAAVSKRRPVLARSPR